MSIQGCSSIQTAVADTAAIEQIFAERWVAPDGEALACQESDSDYGQMICTIGFGDNDSVDIYLNGGPSLGWRSYAVGLHGNPPGWEPVD